MVCECRKCTHLSDHALNLNQLLAAIFDAFHALRICTKFLGKKKRKDQYLWGTYQYTITIDKCFWVVLLSPFVNLTGGLTFKCFKTFLRNVGESTLAEKEGNYIEYLWDRSLILYSIMLLSFWGWGDKILMFDVWCLHLLKEQKSLQLMKRFCNLSFLLNWVTLNWPVWLVAREVTEHSVLATMMGRFGGSSLVKQPFCFCCREII